MKAYKAILIAGAILAMSCVMAAVPGCLNPPAGTVYIDTNGDGVPDALAVDENRDGVPDADADGKPLIVEGSAKYYKPAAAADSVMPTILAVAGGLAGIPVLTGIGAAWKGARFGRIFANTVMSIQAARQKLKDKGLKDALDVLDETLDETQTQATFDAIAKAKEKLQLPSVTTPAQ